MSGIVISYQKLRKWSIQALGGMILPSMGILSMMFLIARILRQAQDERFFMFLPGIFWKTCLSFFAVVLPTAIYVIYEVRSS